MSQVRLNINHEVFPMISFIKVNYLIFQGRGSGRSSGRSSGSKSFNIAEALAEVGPEERAVRLRKIEDLRAVVSRDFSTCAEMLHRANWEVLEAVNAFLSGKNEEDLGDQDGNGNTNNYSKFQNERSDSKYTSKLAHSYVIYDVFLYLTCHFNGPFNFESLRLFCATR
jgi:hypothetical protein